MSEKFNHYYSMFRKTFFLFAFAFSLLIQPLQAQKSESRASDGKLYKKSTNYYNKGQYDKAREMLYVLVQRNPDHCRYNFRLALNYYFTHFQKENAIPYFEKALGSCKKDTIGEIYYYLGDLYQFNGQLEKAIEAYNNMKRYVKKNPEGVNLMNELNYRIAQCNEGKAFAVAVDKKVRIENLGTHVNSRYADHTPVISNDGSVLFFTSTRTESGSQLNDFHEEKMFENIYLTKITEGKFSFADKITSPDVYAGIIPNPSGNNALIGFSADQKQVFTYNNQNIYLTELTSSGWKGPSVLPEPINLRNSFEPHSCLSSDGKTIYFASNRKGGFGGLDLYKAELNADGTWGEAVNLGPEVNSKKDENSPFLTPDGNKLYFSSKGHNTIGGYDIFYSENVNNTWSKPKNMGRPINSTSDDVHYVPVGGEDEIAYFASSRADGVGGIDIYKISFIYRPEFENCAPVASAKPDPNPVNPVYLHIQSPDTVVAGAKVSFNGIASRIKDQEIRDFFWDLGDGSDNKVEKGSAVSHMYKVPGTYQVKMEVHSIHNQKLTADNFCGSKTITVISEEEMIRLIAQKIASAKNENLLAKYNSEFGSAGGSNADFIYYDFSKPNFVSESQPIVDRTLEILKSNPDLKVMVVGHTDSRGPAMYNKYLSVSRAKAVRNYLISKGVDPSRIDHEGRGEDELLNNCGDGVKCSEEEHRQNRRAEILIK
jgi:outer membrane protein OmpA-like peptidoglycan-associated protein